MPAPSPNVERFLQRLARIERELRNVSAQPQLAQSTVEGGAIDFNSDIGTPTMSVGYQFDGTNAPAVLTGPPPPDPTTPTASAQLNAARVTWDGLFANGAIVPMDFARVEIHASTDPSDLALTANTIVGTYETPRGGDAIVPIPSGTVYIRLVARSLSGGRSNATAAASVVATTSTDITAAVAAIANSALTIANSAATDAGTAITTANGKNRIYYASTAPTGGTYAVGDLWFDTSLDSDGVTAKNRPSRWTGTSWALAPIGDSAISYIDIGKATVGTLNVARLGAMAITTDKLAIGSFDNLIPDPTFVTAYGVVAWPTTANWAINATGARNGGRAMRVTNTAADQDLFPNPTDAIKCIEGDAFALQWWAKSSVAQDFSVVMLARFKSTSGTFTTFVLGDDQSGAAGTYTRYFDQVIAPANAVSVSFGMRSAAALSTGTVDWDYVSATRAGTGELIVDGSIQAKHILAGSITADKLDVNALSAGFVLTGKITVSDPFSVGPGITISPNQGIVIPQPDGGTITLPADGTAATVTADVTAYSLNVKDALTISGSGKLNGQMTVSNGVTAPSSNPKISYEWPSMVAPAIGDGVNDSTFIFAGLTDYHGDTAHYTSASFLGATGIRKIKKSDGSFDGDITGGWSTRFYSVGGIARIGNTYYLLGQDGDRNSDFYIYAIDGPTGTKNGDFRIGNSGAFGNVRPRIVANNAQIGMVWINGTGNLNLRWYNANMTGLTVGSDIILKTGVGQQAIGGAVVGQSATDDLGTGFGNRCLFVSLASSNATATKTIMAWSGVTTTAATRQSTYDKARAQGKSVHGLHYDTAMGRVLSIDHTGTLWYYSRYLLASSIQAAYTYADDDNSVYPGAIGSSTTVIGGVDKSGLASGKHETLPSGTAVLTIPAGSWPHFECSPPPDDGVTSASLVDKANRIGLYWNVGGAPKLHSYLGVNGTAPFSSIRTYGVSISAGVPAATDTTPTGAAAPANATDFTNAQVPSPGSIKSAVADAGFDGITNLVRLGGDGIFRFGSYGSVRHYGAMSNNANLTIATGNAVTPILFSNVKDAASGLSWDTTNKRWIVAKDGLYSVDLVVQWTGNATGRRAIYIYRGSTPIQMNEYSPGNATGSPTQTLHAVVPCVAGDTIQAQCFQTSGGNLDIVGGNTNRLAFTCAFMSQ